MSECRFDVSPVNYPDPDPGPRHVEEKKNLTTAVVVPCESLPVHRYSVVIFTFSGPLGL